MAKHSLWIVALLVLFVMGLIAWNRSEFCWDVDVVDSTLVKNVGSANFLVRVGTVRYQTEQYTREEDAFYSHYQSDGTWSE